MLFKFRASPFIILKLGNLKFSNLFKALATIEVYFSKPIKLISGLLMALLILLHRQFFQ